MEDIKQLSLPLHARVLIGQMQPGQVEESVRFVRETVLPQYQQQPGFKGLLLLTDARTHKNIGISFWETEADMQTHMASGLQDEHLSKGAHLLVEPEQSIREQKNYEVIVLV